MITTEKRINNDMSIMAWDLLHVLIGPRMIEIVIIKVTKGLPKI